LAGLVTMDYSLGWGPQTQVYEDFWTLRGFLRNSIYNGWHPVLPWAAFVLYGMWLGRFDLNARRLPARLMVFGGLAAALALLPAHFVQDELLHELLEATPIPAGPFFVIAATGSASAVIGAVLAITPTLQRIGLAEWLAAPGRQALTLYVLHILLGMTTIQAMGWQGPALDPRLVFRGSLAFCLLAALYARVWARFAARGPLETAMRFVTGPARMADRTTKE
jgi:uncharacterized membrane protein YeiB